MIGTITSQGESELASLKKDWLEAGEFCLGRLVDGETEEVAYPGYARASLELETVTLANGRLALKGWIRFDGPSSTSDAAYQVVYLVRGELTIYRYQFDEEKTLPPGGVARWQVTFDV